MPESLQFYLKHHNIYSYNPSFGKFVLIKCWDISEFKSQFPDKNNLFACLKKRTADDSSTQSFEVRMENGNVKLRNKRFLRHAIKGPDRHVQFNPQGVEQDHVEEESDNSRGQPVLNADNAESNVGRPRTRSMDRQTA